MATTNIRTFNGSVGIGTNTTSYKFEVYDGSSRVEDITATSVTSTSTTEASNRTTAAVTVAGGMVVEKTLRCENAQADTSLSVGTVSTTNAVNISGTLKTTSITIGGITNAYVPSGAIAIWSGSTGTIPSGWVICNGSNNTPDLRDKFILGSSGAPDHNTTGGSAQVTLAAGNIVQHAHGGETGNYDGHAHTGDTSNKTQHAHTGDTGNAGTHGHPNSDTGQGGQHDHTCTSDGSGQHNHGISDPGHGHTFVAGPAFQFFGIGKQGGAILGNANYIHQANSGGSFDQTTHNHAEFDTQDAPNHSHTGTSQNASAVHAHTLTAPDAGGHEHTFTYGQAGGHEHTYTTGSAGQGTAFEVLPPYYALAYIMKN
jgi:hypothetical protein